MMTDQLKRVRDGRRVLLCGMVVHTIWLGYLVSRKIWPHVPEMGPYISGGMHGGVSVFCLVGLNTTAPASKQGSAANIWPCIFSGVPLVGLIVLTVRYVRTSGWLAAAAA